MWACVLWPVRCLVRVWGITGRGTPAILPTLGLVAMCAGPHCQHTRATGGLAGVGMRAARVRRGMQDSSAKSLLGRPWSPSAVHMGAHLALGTGVDDPEAGALLFRPGGDRGPSPWLRRVAESRKVGRPQGAGYRKMRSPVSLGPAGTLLCG